jgi:Glucosamine 6-phosphate synthetase, contains amidotransferase and phosphosugar isomerase domains
LPILPRSDSTAEFQPLEDKAVEYFFASDASAVIEHTNRVIFLEVSQASDYKSQILNIKEILPSFYRFLKTLFLIFDWIFTFIPHLSY